MNERRKWRPGINRAIEEALEEAEPAADWLMRHPPGAKLPDHLEPGAKNEVHLAVLGERQGICGSKVGTFTISEKECTCEDCLYIQDSADGPLFADEYGDY
jgi:hypothetical protein